jgi:hypothetical protein
MVDEPVLDTAAVGRILEVSAKTVVRYLNESRPGKRYEGHPFPAPDGRERGRLFWLASRRMEIDAWDNGRPGTGWHFPPCSCVTHRP